MNKYGMDELILNKAKKQKRDWRTLKVYEKRLRAKRKEYMQTFSAFAINQRRSRAACVGELCLQAMEAVRGLNRTKPLLDGSLDYSIIEQKVKDPDGRKGFQYMVTYHVFSSEDALSAEDIAEEIEKTRKQLEQETEEMFREDPDEETEPAE